MTRSILAEPYTTILNKELRSKNMKEYFVTSFYFKASCPSYKSDSILSFLENESKNYLKFREERFLKKEKKLADTIKRITEP